MWILGLKGLTSFEKRGDKNTATVPGRQHFTYLSFEFDHAKKNITDHITLSRHIQ